MIGQTGATEEQLDRAIKRALAIQPKHFHRAPYEELIPEFATYLVPPGYVIARAEDVVTDELRAAMALAANTLVEIHESGREIGYEAWQAAGLLRVAAKGGAS